MGGPARLRPGAARSGLGSAPRGLRAGRGHYTLNKVLVLLTNGDATVVWLMKLQKMMVMASLLPCENNRWHQRAIADK